MAIAEADLLWLKIEREKLLRRAARLRRRGNDDYALRCDHKAARFLRIYNELRLAVMSPR